MVTCVECGVEIAPLDVFPKGRCMDCHALTFVMPTADELARMWGGG